MAGCVKNPLIQHDPTVGSKDAPEDIDSDLVVHWMFGDITGNILTDVSTNLLHGSIHGAQNLVNQGHAALAFDGQDDYVRMMVDGGKKLEPLARLGEGSISIWFKLDRLPEGERIFPVFYYGRATACNFFDAANEGLIVEVGHHPVQRNSKRLYFTQWANGCTYPSFCFDSNHALEAGKWYHFVAVVGSDYNTGYLNGVEMLTRRYNFGTPDDSEFFENAVKHEALWLGRGFWNKNLNYFDGLIGEIRIYSAPLSSFQVEKLYEMGSS
jgi:hypothetical protein